jgi:serine/threonine protein kinase
VEIAIQLCQALAAVHAAGLVHSDVKAANILRERGGRVVLADLGSGVEQRSASALGSAQLSPLTAAPDVLAGGAPSAASDLYSLCVLLYRLLGARTRWRPRRRRAERATPRRASPLRDCDPIAERLLEIVERVLT